MVSSSFNIWRKKGLYAIDHQLHFFFFIESLKLSHEALLQEHDKLLLSNKSKLKQVTKIFLFIYILYFN